MKASYLIWANQRCSDSRGSPPNAWLAMVNWWLMQAAGPRTSSIRPVACIVPGYCINISETVYFTAVCSKSLIAYATQIYICKFWREILNDRCVKRSWINMICKEICLFSMRALVKEIPTRVDFVPENIHPPLMGFCAIHALDYYFTRSAQDCKMSRTISLLKLLPHILEFNKLNEWFMLFIYHCLSGKVWYLPH